MFCEMGQGVYEAAQQLSTGLLEGVQGVITSPVRGAASGGVPGLARGLSHGNLSALPPR